MEPAALVTATSSSEYRNGHRGVFFFTAAHSLPDLRNGLGFFGVNNGTMAITKPLVWRG